MIFTRSPIYSYPYNLCLTHHPMDFSDLGSPLHRPPRVASQWRTPRNLGNKTPRNRWDFHWHVADLPLWKIWVNGKDDIPIYGKINVPKHQPVIHVDILCFCVFLTCWWTFIIWGCSWHVSSTVLHIYIYFSGIESRKECIQAAVHAIHNGIQSSQRTTYRDSTSKGGDFSKVTPVSAFLVTSTVASKSQIDLYQSSTLQVSQYIQSTIHIPRSTVLFIGHGP